MKDQGPYQATIFFGKVLGGSFRAIPGISLRCRHIHSTGGAMVRGEGLIGLFKQS